MHCYVALSYVILINSCKDQYPIFKQEAAAKKADQCCVRVK